MNILTQLDLDEIRGMILMALIIVLPAIIDEIHDAANRTRTGRRRTVRSRPHRA